MKNRFTLQKSEHPGKWVCTDTVNKIVCVFEDHKYNNTQQFTILEDVEMPNVLALAKIANEMAEWLSINHYDKVF